MVKRGMNLLSILAGAAALASPPTQAAQNDANVGINVEMRYGAGKITTEQQVDLIYDTSKVSGSLVLDDFALSKYGMSAGTGSVASNIGDFSAKKATSYFTRTSQSRGNDSFVGMRTEYTQSSQQAKNVQWFGGTTLADDRVFIDANKFSLGREESKVYFRAPEGSLVGISMQDAYGQQSKGVYYAKKDFDTYAEVSGKSMGARVSLRNILGKIKGIIADEDERMDAEVEHLQGKRSSALFKYSLRNFNLAAGAAKIYREGARALFQSSMVLGAAKVNMMYEPAGKRFKLDINAQY